MAKYEMSPDFATASVPIVIAIYSNIGDQRNITSLSVLALDDYNRIYLIVTFDSQNNGKWTKIACFEL